MPTGVYKHKNRKGGEIKRNCQNCGKEFFIQPANTKRGRGKFCSRKCYGKWLSKNQRGKNHHNWKEKIKRICIICGKAFYVHPCNGSRNFCSRKCKGVWQSQNRIGENNPAWKGGLAPASAKRIHTPEWDIIRKRVYARDNWTCQVCKKHCRNNIQCHHIVPYRITQDNSENNLITLCCSCHIKEELKYYSSLKTD